MHPDAAMIEARAIDWVIAQRDPDFADWDAFADWLAEDAAHAAAYDAVALLDADLEALPARPAAPVAANDEEPRARPSRRGWFGGAIAAALVAVVTIPNIGLFGDPNRIETAPGEHRTLELADGSRIEINGGSVVTLDEERPRFAKLESGEAMFHVVHRESDPFVVETGGARLVDLGTAFNVVRRDHATSVAVSEGIVVYNPHRDNVRMVAGEGIEARDGDKKAPAVRKLDSSTIGGWRSGQLVYADTPLSVVAGDLGRTAGLTVSVAPEAADLPFRGALVIGADKARAVADLAALSGTRAERRGDGWVLTR
ncbi:MULTISPECIES: FecR family protein [unclassified Sphingopyxis]|uniref:FecR family protein n=1 Tax=unclassified Sphingopyxis TaxID=2614943 RepID=UPI000736999B|nr:MULTISPECIES: FecR domain-containing protein [unclassified Sphingopyxis]KTE41443.1 iron dicitrate transport regulator FecR [Sphingopyxis sp. HIX]KTE83995.1 iron dicitrate transport regulator FecR [Sphingopyxis sp. HXXIV]